MKVFASRICIGCIGGLYSGLIVTAVLVFIFVPEISAKLLLSVYGFAMLAGMLTGGGVSAFNCYRHARSKGHSSCAGGDVNRLELFWILTITLCCVLMIGYFQLY